MANSLTYYQELTAPGRLDGSKQLAAPITLPDTSLQRTIRIQCTQVQISDRIPNIFDGRPYGLPFNNTRLRVGTDIHGYVTVVLPMGLYLDADMLNAGINEAINTVGWWLNPADPGLTIRANGIIDCFTIEIDSSKLDPVHGAQFMLDMQKATTDSDFYQLVGFPSTAIYIIDGLYTSTIRPVMETQGTACILECDLMPLRRFGDADRRILAEISFAGKTTPSDTIWPQGGQISPAFAYTGQRTITNYAVTVKTRRNLPMIFMGGLLTFTLIFI